MRHRTRESSWQNPDSGRTFRNYFPTAGENAEDRYQSARGLNNDLEYVRQELKDTYHLENFTPGQKDYSDKLFPPQKLYGRENELKTLLNSFSRALEGRVELLLVGGYSGVGKSSLVHELFKEITARNGNFVSGKFDQYQRNIPFLSFSQAIGEFCGRLLGEKEEILKVWKERILAALGVNGRVLCELVPELEAVIGKQPAVLELPPQENKNRFLLVFNNFIQAISSSQYPLVIFLDDLQWADLASLELLESLMSGAEAGLLRFSFEKCNWTWKLDEIKGEELSDNVVDLMASKIKTLTETTHKALELAACIGGRFTLSTLSTISNQDPQKILDNLWEAIQEGLILPLDQNYKIPESADVSRFRFLHDRVQQAAYSMIAPEERSAVHLRS